MFNEKISIVVVVYKVEKFLEQCLKSLKEQTYTNIEVILSVSDGGDNCVDICRQYSEDDSRFVLVVTPPQGIAMARNSGLKYVSGKYLTWVDGDDWVEPTYIESLYKSAKRNNCEVSICGFYKNYSDKEEKILSSIDDTRPISLDKVYEELLSYNSFGMEIWDKLFKTELVKNFEFPAVREAEDRYWLLSVLERVDKLSYVKSAEYHYRIRSDSCSRTDENATVSLDADKLLAENIIKRYPGLTGKVHLFLFLAEYRVLYEVIQKAPYYDFYTNGEIYKELRRHAVYAQRVCSRKEDLIKIILARVNFRMLTKFVIMTQKRRTVSK